MFIRKNSARFFAWRALNSAAGMALEYTKNCSIRYFNPFEESDK